MICYFDFIIPTNNNNNKQPFCDGVPMIIIIIGVVYCPYKACKIRCSALHIMFQHIKTDHKVEIPKIIETSKNETLMLKANSNGKLIDILEGIKYTYR